MIGTRDAFRLFPALLATSLCLRLFTALGQPDNDAFAHRARLSGPTPRAVGATLDASRETGEIAPTGAGPLEASVWWSWIAPRTGSVRAVARGDTGVPTAAVRVSRGSQLDQLVPVQPADEQAERGTFFTAQGGEAYELAVVASSATAAFFTVEIDYVAPNTGVPDPLAGTFGDRTATTVDALPAPGWWGAPSSEPTVFAEWSAPGVGVLWIAQRENRPGLSVTVYRRQPDGQFAYAAGGPGFPYATLLTEAGAVYRWAFSSVPGTEGEFPYYFTWSQFRVAGVTPDALVSGADPLALEVADLPAGVDFAALVLMANGEAVATNAPPPLEFQWQPRDGGDATVWARAFDRAGREWWGMATQFKVRPPNDDFARARVLAGAPIFLRAANPYASTEASEPAGSASLWYRWTAPADGQAAFVGGFSGWPQGRISLDIYRGEALGALTRLGASTPSAAYPTVLVPVVKGESYRVRITGTSPVAYAGWLSIECQPPLANDNFADRLLLTGHHAEAVYPAWFATVQSGERGPFDGAAYRTAWYSWHCPTNGELRLAASASDGNPALPLPWIGTNLLTLQRISTASDPTINVLVSAGLDYQLQVSSQPGTRFVGPTTTRLKLDFTPAPPNDVFSSATALTGEAVTVNGTLVAARGETEGPQIVRASTTSVTSGNRAVWYTWTAPRSTVMTFAVVNSLNVRAQIFRGTTLAGLTSVAGPITTGESLSFPATAGLTYVLAFVSLDRNPGTDFCARLVPSGAAPNDQFANRQVLTGSRATFVANHEKATSELGDPGLTTVWWTWTAPASGWATLRATSSIQIFVYAGSDRANLTRLAVESYGIPMSESAFAAVTGFECQAGTSYQFALNRPTGVSVPAFYPVALDLTSLRFAEPAPSATVSEGQPIVLRFAGTDVAVDGDLRNPVGLFRTSAGESSPLTLATNQVTGFRLTPFGTMLRVLAIATNTADTPRFPRPLSFWIAPTNDAFAFATEAPQLDLYSAFLLHTATREPNEPPSPLGNTAGSLWWKWTAPFSGEMQWPVYAYLDWAATIYRGATFAELEAIAGHQFVAGDHATLKAPVRRGETLHLALTGEPAVGGWVGSPSVAVLRLTDLQPPVLRFFDQREFDFERLAPEAEIERIETLNGLNVVFTSYHPPFHIRMPDPYPIGADQLSARVWFRGSDVPWTSPMTEIYWRPRNDLFASRPRLSGETLELEALPANATREPGESDHGFPASTRTVWWGWTAPHDGLLDLTSLMGYGLVLSSGSDLTTLVTVASAAGHLQAEVTGGREYQLVLAGWQNATTDQVRLRFARAGVAVDQGVVTGDTALLRTDFGRRAAEPRDPQRRTWRWTAASNGAIALAWDPFLAGLTVDVRDLTSEGQPMLTPFLSPEALALTGVSSLFRVTAGRLYEIGFNASPNLIEPFTARLHWVPVVANDLFAQPAELTGTNPAAVTQLEGATLEPGDPALRLGWTLDLGGSVWLAWQAPASGAVVVRTSADVDAAVATGDELAGLTLVATSGDALAAFDATAGQTYRIAVSALKTGAAFALVTLELTPAPVAPPANDAFRNRTPLSGAWVRFDAHNTGATREPNEPLHADVYGSRSVWWSWTASVTGAVRIRSEPVDLAGHQIAVYDGEMVDALTPIAAQAFTGAGEFWFDAIAGQTYALVLDGRHGTDVATQIELLASTGLGLWFEQVRLATDGRLRIRFTGPAGAAFRLEDSPDLSYWMEVAYGEFLPGGNELELPAALDYPARYFRLRVD